MRSDEKRAFVTEIERQHGRSLRRFLASRLRNAAADVPDLVQEVFLRLYVTLKKREQIRNHRAWIFRVAHNLGLKVRARQNAQPAYDPELGARIQDPEANPEMSLLERERIRLFHRAVEALSEQQRRCLFLRLNGLRYPEIGDVLGISASAVGEFLRRAVARLRRGER